MYCRLSLSFGDDEVILWKHLIALNFLQPISTQYYKS